MVKGKNKNPTSRRFYSRSQIRDDVRGMPDGYTGLNRPEPEMEDVYDDIVEKIKSQIASTLEKELESTLRETVGKRKKNESWHDSTENNIGYGNSDYDHNGWPTNERNKGDLSYSNDPWKVANSKSRWNSRAEEPVYQNNHSNSRWEHLDDTQDSEDDNWYSKRQPPQVAHDLSNSKYTQLKEVPVVKPSNDTSWDMGKYRLNNNNYTQNISPENDNDINKKAVNVNQPNGNDDKIAFLEKELLAAYQRESKLKTRIDELELNVNKTQSGLSAQIMDLKQDIAPQQPQKEENKLSLLSEQLATVMKTISTEVQNEEISASEVSNDKKTETKTETESKDNVAEIKGGAKTEASGDNKPEDKSKEKGKNDDKPNDKKGGKKKYLIIFAIIILVIAGIGGGAFYWLNRSPQVDPNLLKQYLPDGVSPTPVPDQTNNQESSSSSQTADSNPTVTPQVQGVATESRKYAESYAEVDYADTKWETHKNPQIGVEFDYPGNSTNAVRTDTSVTILRKTGYIFKIQYIESALELNDYWNQIKARNLTYKATPKNFRDYPALFLELAEPSEYPGDRYLVKKGEVIYDIWYATKSKNLNDDDAKRVDVMLNSLKFIS